jgi:hypothetical protein
MASDNEIERLTVTLELDYQQYLRDVDKAVAEAMRKLKETNEIPKKQQTGWEQLTTFLSGKFMQVITGVGVTIAAAFSVGAVTNFFKTIASGMVETNKQFETFTVQFTTLLGSTSEAQKRIDELAKFGVATPFELDEIVEGNRLLQTFGDTALATGENLRRVGDSAAAVNASFQEVSFWTGRLYSSMMAGRPFGEASARLQELGILSGEARTKLEDMQKSGAKGSEIWAAYAEMIDTKFTGAMDKLSKTLQGVMSNLADFQQMLLREGGEELFEGVREDAIEFYDVIKDPEVQQALIGLSKAFGSILDSLRQAVTTPFLEQLKDLDSKQIDDLSISIQNIGGSIGQITGVRITSLSELVATLQAVTQEAATILQTLNKLKQILEIIDPSILGMTHRLRDMGVVGEELRKGFIGLLSPLTGAVNIFNQLDKGIEELTGSNMYEWLGGVEERLKNVETAGDHAFNMLQRGAKQAVDSAVAPTEEPEDFSKAQDRFEKLSQDFLDAQKEVQAEQEEAERDHGERVTNIVEDYQEQIADLEEDTAQRRAEIVKDSADRLADLEEEGAERREEIAEDTAKALTKLERDTAEAKADAIADAQSELAAVEEEARDSVAEVQEEARDKERRETEDHQRDMQRLQQDYLLNLEDAVKNRDARAIVDLRRKYTTEKREREEDFRTQQSRSREEARDRIEEAREAEEKRKREIEEALEKQLQDIEENEAEKRAEIEASQQEQLAKLAETEAEKRAEIAASEEEQLAKLAESEAQKRAQIEESLAEQLATENANYAERQAALDAALQKRLEAVAQQLAQEKEITEAGAQAILETLNQYYGVGGRMDQVMEGYRQRQQAQMAATANFNANLPGSGPGGGEFTPAGSGGGSGIPAFAQGGIVPGQPGQKRLIIAHAGELVIPPDQTSQWMQQQGDMMASNFDNSPKILEVKISGSAPPGVGGQEIEAMASMMVKAFGEAGIRAKRR